LGAAYQVLSNEVMREQYDKSGKSESNEVRTHGTRRDDFRGFSLAMFRSLRGALRLQMCAA
jgi:DnaJ-class molecular chaperone